MSVVRHHPPFGPLRSSRKNPARQFAPLPSSLDIVPSSSCSSPRVLFPAPRLSLSWQTDSNAFVIPAEFCNAGANIESIHLDIESMRIDVPQRSWAGCLFVPFPPTLPATGTQSSKPDPASICQCIDANFPFDFLSCVQGECQAAEVNSAYHFLASECGAAFLSATDTDTTPFLPSNPNADINKPLQTTCVHSHSLLSNAQLIALLRRHRRELNHHLQPRLDLCPFKHRRSPHRAQVMDHTFSALPVRLTMCNKNSERSAAMAAPVVADVRRGDLNSSRLRRSGKFGAGTRVE
ncbi:hypothetical protein C8R45DRAFT_1224759 [Mycena sanguinolenta]|nr:hypothetical protein C8R45DRAFT_1224759 [Mycena sanguinolenta]